MYNLQEGDVVIVHGDLVTGVGVVSQTTYPNQVLVRTIGYRNSTGVQDEYDLFFDLHDVQLGKLLKVGSIRDKAWRRLNDVRLGREE